MALTPDLSDVASIQDDVVVRRMIALFDYDPWENSPNMDSEVSAVTHQTQCFKLNIFVSLNVFAD